MSKPGEGGRGDILGKVREFSATFFGGHPKCSLTQQLSSTVGAS